MIKIINLPEEKYFLFFWRNSKKIYSKTYFLETAINCLTILLVLCKDKIKLEGEEKRELELYKKICIYFQSSKK